VAPDSIIVWKAVGKWRFSQRAQIEAEPAAIFSY
jgi:hypothetical protein